jgi:hypothetical protein
VYLPSKSESIAVKHINIIHLPRKSRPPKTIPGSLPTHNNRHLRRRSRTSRIQEIIRVPIPREVATRSIELIPINVRCDGSIVVLSLAIVVEVHAEFVSGFAEAIDGVGDGDRVVLVGSEDDVGYVGTLVAGWC